jgi:trimethylamine--corrinoid protein Co-methyltransferase
MTDAKVADVQAGYEKGYTVALAAQAGADMVQLSVGMLASIMVASPEALVIDDEMSGAILRSVRGVELDDDALDLDALAVAAAGDGHFLGQDQTLARMRTEYVYPSLGDRSSVAEWLENGSPAVWDRARARVADIVGAGRPGHLSRAAEAAIRDGFDILLPEES